jgi:hypothetical protein
MPLAVPQAVMSPLNVTLQLVWTDMTTGLPEVD